MKEKTTNGAEDEAKEERGIVVMENIPGFTEKYYKIVRKYGFKAANKTTNRVKDLISNVKTPLGDKRTDVVYRIPCKCNKFSYTGETFRKWETRKKEHMDKERLTKEDIQSGNVQRANDRMNTGDGGLAKHANRALARSIGRTQK